MAKEKSRANAVANNLEGICGSLNDGFYQDPQKSLVVIAQCLIDINFTLALMLDKMIEDNKKGV